MRTTTRIRAELDGKTNPLFDRHPFGRHSLRIQLRIRTSGGMIELSDREAGELVGYVNPSVMLLGRIRGSVRRVGRVCGACLAGLDRGGVSETLVSVVSARARDVAYGCCSGRRRCAGHAQAACG